MNLGLRFVRFVLGTFVLISRLGALETVGAEVPALRHAGAQGVPTNRVLGPLPWRAPDPRDNPSTTNKIALGRLLFFDPILSASGDVSCATCHNPRFGWSDGRATPIGVGGVGVGPARTFGSTAGLLPLLERNSPTLLNVGFNGLVSGSSLDPSHAPMFWDSRVAGLEQQAVLPIKSPAEMCGEVCDEEQVVRQRLQKIRAIPSYRELFAVAFGEGLGEAVSPLHLAQALAAFERSLITPRTAYDRFMEGDTTAMTADARQGLKLFQGAGCIQCHGGPMLSDYKLHFIGVADPSPGGRREFRTPSLRNLRYTAPYMHNGSLRTLREVLVFYDELGEAVSETLEGGDSHSHPPLDPLLKHLDLNPDDFPALEAFLDALNADAYDQSEPSQVPSGLPLR